jgi:deoxyadenosine/deoxycytidine kinase
MKKFITIAGNIGAGKSSLVRLLSQRLEWNPFFEPVANNPYLSDFYADMRTWSFHSQTYFLSNRLKVYGELLECPNSVILDRSLYEDAEVFARNLYLQGFMSQRDYETYENIYQTLLHFLPTPDLVVYLRASVETLLDRIRRRNRDYEQNISATYLQQLNDMYETWVQNFTLCPVLTVPSDNLDFVNHSRHMDLILGKIQEKIAGKEEVIFSLEECSQL